MIKSDCIRIIIFCMILCVCAIRGGTLYSEEPLPELSIDKAVETALQNNQDYATAFSRMRAAEEKVGQVWGQLVPSLESEASALRQGAENGFMSLSDGQYDLKIVQLKFGINPGAFYHILQQSYAGYGMAKEELKRIKSEVEYNVIKSFFDVILAGEAVSLRKNSIQVLQENLKDVQRLYQTGSVPKFELLQAQVKLKSQEPELFEAESNFRTALDFFNYQLGFDRIKYTADKNKISEKIKEPAKDDVITELVDLAMRNRPEVIQLDLWKKGIEHAISASQSSYLWPVFSVAGYYGKSYMLSNPVDIELQIPGGSPDLSQITGSREWQDTWQIRFAATYRWGSLLPVDTQRAVEREEKEKLKEAEGNITKVQRLTAISIRSGFAKLSSAYQSILSQRQNVETADEGLRIARESYNAGVIKNADLLNAELYLSQSKTGLIKSLYEYYLGIASLNKEMGVKNDKLIFGEDAR